MSDQILLANYVLTVGENVKLIKGFEVAQRKVNKSKNINKFREC
jgi:hypothetical protein